MDVGGEGPKREGATGTSSFFLRRRANERGASRAPPPATIAAAAAAGARTKSHVPSLSLSRTSRQPVSNINRRRLSHASYASHAPTDQRAHTHTTREKKREREREPSALSFLIPSSSSPSRWTRAHARSSRAYLGVPLLTRARRDILRHLVSPFLSLSLPLLFRHPRSLPLTPESHNKRDLLRPTTTGAAPCCRSRCSRRRSCIRW